MTLHPPRPTVAGRWRVHVDIEQRLVAGRPGIAPEALIATLVNAAVPTAIIDLDRCLGQRHDLTLLSDLAHRWSDTLWLGGRLGGNAADLHHLLDAGAAGLILGSALYRTGTLNHELLDQAIRECPVGRRLIALDVADNHIVANGFTTPIGLPARQLLDDLAEVVEGNTQVLYVDIPASMRRSPPPWTELGVIASVYGSILDLWYAGGLTTWSDIRRLWQTGFSAVVGRAYLTGPLGLPASN